MRRFEALALLLCAALPAAGLAAEAPQARARKYYYEDIAEPFFLLDADRGVYRNMRPNSKTSAFAAEKPKNGFRVFVIGGSIGSLLQYDGDKREFAQALRAALPGRTVEVSNCGMPGYDTFREALIEQEILEYQPDLIVILTGHNEGIASAPIPIWIMRTQERLSRLASFRALVKTFNPENSKVKHSDARSDARDATFARNLAENLRHARERGVPVAVVVPPRNYREPVELGHTPYDADFVPGWIRFLRGDYKGARKFWKENMGVEAEAKAFAWGFIARSEEKLGLLEEARSSFERASDFDRAAICGRKCQAIIRRTAESEGGFLVEADAMFRAQTFPRMPGLETFNDRMHWKPQFNCMMSVELLSAMRAQPALAALPWDEAELKALAASCVKPGGPTPVEDDLRILGYVLMGLSWPDFSRLSTVSFFSLQAIRQNRPEWFKDVPALMKRAVNQQTQVYGLAMAPDAVVLPRFYWHIGEVRMLEKDYSGASADFTKALSLDPKMPGARLSLATAEGLRGNNKAALEQFKEAVARAPEDARRPLLLAAMAAGKELGLQGAADVAAADPDYWIKKAGSAVAMRSKPEAMAALAKALALTPQPHQLRLIGQYYSRLEENGAFLEVFDRLAAAYPRDVDLRLSHAEALFALGRKDEALAAVAQAEKLGPSDQQRLTIRLWRARFKVSAR